MGKGTIKDLGTALTPLLEKGQCHDIFVSL